MSPVFPALLIRKLNSIGALSKESEQELRNLSGTVRELAPGEPIVLEGDHPNTTTLLLSGHLCRYKHVPDGKRQILSFHIPGDIPDLQSLFIQVMDHSLGALGHPATVVLIRHEVIKSLIKRSPEIGELLWRNTLIEASVFREWATNIGRRDAHARIAHLFCEVLTRTNAIGLGDGHRCDFPVTQLDIADAVGLTDVHVNRTLRDLRNDGIVEFRRGQIIVLNWGRLKGIGQFDAAYLHLRSEQAA